MGIKKIYLSAGINNMLLKCSFCLLICLGCKSNKGPMISYQGNIMNMGEVKFREPSHGFIMLKNTGGDVLKILKITPDCSCIVSQNHKIEIAPEDSAKIEFSISPSDLGFIQQNLIVENNSDNEKRILFLIRAKVKL